MKLINKNIEQNIGLPDWTDTFYISPSNVKSTIIEWHQLTCLIDFISNLFKTIKHINDHKNSSLVIIITRKQTSCSG